MSRGKHIGYIGLGKMGLNMVQNLAKHNWKVVATDASEEARTRANEVGAEVKESAAEVVMGKKKFSLLHCYFALFVLPFKLSYATSRQDLSHYWRCESRPACC